MKKHAFILAIIAAISLIALLVLRMILGGWENYMFVPLGFFLASSVAAIYIGRKYFAEFMAVKTTREGMSMGMMIMLTLVLLVAVNYLAAKKTKTFDYSSAQVNTLSDQSKAIIKNLTEDLQVLYFYQKGAEGVEENKRAFIDLLKKYTDQSSLVKLQFVEVNENPKLTEEFGVNKGSGLVFVVYKGRKNRIEKIDEQELTGALVKVTREKDKKIFFTVGHGERDIEEVKEPAGINALKKLLEGNRYLVGPLNLNKAAEVPMDADLVVIAGPQYEFLDHEVKAIEKYLYRGGSILIALEAKQDAGLGPMLYRLGVRMSSDLVAQVMETPIGKAINPQITPVSQFAADHAVTKPFSKNDLILMRLPAPIIKEKTVDGITYSELAKTDINSMAFPNNDFKGAAKPGPHTAIAAVQGKHPEAGAEAKEFNLILASDVDFVANQLLYKNLNRDLILNAISYLGREENLISITPKEVTVTKMQMTPNQFYIFIFGFIIPLPMLLITTSGVLWYRRRYA